MKEKHIENLTRGRKSGARIGSRATPHRLNQHEQTKFTLAIKRRYLTLSFDARPNLDNIWRKYCEAKAWPLIILSKNQDGTAEIEHIPLKEDPIILKFDTAKEAAQHLKEIL